MRMSDNKQKALIHQITGLLGIPKELYKEMLQSRYGVDSSKNLTYKQATEFITLIKKDAIDAGLWESHDPFNKHKFNNLAGREDMATPKQLRMIQAMWKDYSKLDDKEAREKAFRAFISKRFNLSDMKFIDKKSASKIIFALEKMVLQKKSKAS